MAVDLARLRNLADQARSRAQKSNRQRDGRSWYRFTNTGGTGTRVELYDMIGEWGVTAQDFVADLRAAGTGPLDLHVNCEGGEVFDGLAIYEALVQHPGHVRAVVDGIAASAASFIIQAANERVVAKNARVMIHDAHGLAVGNSRDMLAMAALLDDLSDNIASIYADRSGKPVAAWRAAMQAGADGTWYSADAAITAGLADSIAARPGEEGANNALVPPGPRPAGAAVKDWNPADLATTMGEIFSL